LAAALSAPLVAIVVACGGNSGGGALVGGSGSGGNTDDSGVSSGSDDNNFETDGTFFNDAPNLPADNASGACKGGHYGGDFGGIYSSHLTFIGIGIPVTGNVELTLNQEGSAGMMCSVHGEEISCNNVFSLQDGTIQGVADGLFPYFCTMTGTLDCVKKVLVDGWIECTYCIGPLVDGGGACALGGGNGQAGIGGYFSGPLTADYNTATLSFVNGVWNGAEALGMNDGGQPTPDGGPISMYISDAGYGIANFGGTGTWNATFGSDR
jgi:hypothetical protein